MGAKRKQPSGETAPAVTNDEARASAEGNGKNAQHVAGNGVKEKKERGSNEDLKQIQATFKSSLFRLQVTEMLKEVTVDYSKAAVIGGALQALKIFLDSIPEPGAPLSPNLVSGYAAALGVPAAKLQGLRLMRPARVEVVGSFVGKTVAKPVQNVDVAVEIPKAFFHEKDYLNHRYHAKRALYLAGLAKILEAECKAFESAKVVPFRGDARKPILVLTPGKSETGATTKFVVRIIPTIDQGTFDTVKLAPKRNNLRNAKTESGEPLPTPQYSNSILEDMGLAEQSKLLQSALATCPALGEAIVLLKVWARQRGFHDAPDAVNGFLLSMLAAHLTSAAGGRKIGAHMTTYQIFKVVLNALAHVPMLEKGVFLTDASGHTDVTSAKRAALLAAFDVVIADPSGRVNLAARVTKSAAAELAREATRGLALLVADGDDNEAFDALFMTPVAFAERFDFYVRVTTSSGVSRDEPSTPDVPDALTSSDVSSFRTEEDRIELLVAQGLGERALLVRARRRGLEPSWQLEKGLPAAAEGSVLVGVSLAEPDVAFRLADVGPSADDKEAAKKFRDFWGPKAELRRFRDGLIAETAVWDCPDPTERHLVVERVVRHVLCRHLPTVPGKVDVVAGQLDEVLQENGTDPAGVMPTLLDAFTKLSKRLRGLTDLPLKVVSVQPLSAALCHTAVFPPQPHPLAFDGEKPPPEAAEALRSKKVPACLDPLGVLLTLEGSGRWPDAPAAVRKMKTAFLLQIAKSLRDNHSVHVIAAEDAVDVLTDGFAFRLALFYEKDPTRLRKPGPVPGTSGANLNGNTEPAAVSLESDLLLRSTHANLLQAVQGQHPAFGATVRLAKRWVSNHKFSAALRDEAVELLVASLFVHPGPYVAPRTRVAGLLRFLSCLSSHDWANLPLIVDVNSDLTPADRENIQAAFQRSRKQPATGPALFLATPHDPESATWTNKRPTPGELRRLVAYARSSAALLSQQIADHSDDDRWQSAFRTPLGVYEFLVLLRRDALPHPQRTLFPAEEALGTDHRKTKGEAPSAAWLPRSALNKGHDVARQGLLVGFDPVTLLRQEVEERFGEYVVLSQDKHGADALGATWTAKAKQAALDGIGIGKPVKRRKVQGVEKGGPSPFDEASILQAIKSVGKGLVRDVHLVKATAPKAS
ncbi:U3 small nucleolar RNA-associated protein 22 [Klebsormidium nitens]|uniref:U3 small nucleolar RNA-associated protein 22 n=1 Tax=Klebsormidium nitens TaxID=105231 RepID=A0A1Y1I3P1_KLENI|nr:U3 small nucleolar RNA-associated protein 22 [Klebsormidium nitens]|eukprot:GAQ85560.1 U3 small nucleolar RNA-associated protein 22 [Klebsormidium nitens]